MNNNNKSLVYTILAILIAVGLLFLVTIFFRDSGNNPDIENNTVGEIISFTVDRPNFVIVGNSLKEVKIYGIPTGTNVDERSHTMIATANNSKDGNVNQRWLAQIPEDQMLLSQIYAVATDTNDQVLDRFYFSLNGASEIYNSLWLDTPSEVVTLRVGESKDVYGMSITLDSVSNDSRCPVSVECITQGDVDVSATVSSGDQLEELDLSLNQGEAVSAFGFGINVEQVSPTPIVGQNINESDYEVTLLVNQVSKS